MILRSFVNRAPGSLRESPAPQLLSPGSILNLQHYYCIFILQISRLEKNAEGSKYQQKLFASVGNVFVSGNTVPPRHDLQQLIGLCGGQVWVQMFFTVLCGTLNGHLFHWMEMEFPQVPWCPGIFLFLFQIFRPRKSLKRA